MNNVIEPPPKKIKKYRKYIGPSQFATVLGLDDYQTAESFKDEVENGYTPTSTYATQYGNDNESVAIYYYQKLYNTVVKKALFVVDVNNRRIGGVADGLIDSETGLEIKCHVKEDNLLTKLPIKYLLQIAGYMYLYKRTKWVLMSATFNNDKTLNKYVVHTVTWDQVKDKWEQEWYPKITQYVNELKWLT